MPDLHHLLLFVAAGWLLNLTPGPDVLYIVNQSLRSGVRAGVVGGLGITAGCCVHVVAAALGLGALLATSALAFEALRWLGAVYLLWVGLKLLLSRAAAPGALDGVAGDAPPVGLGSVFLGGFWTNVLNPKVAIFFLAFVPQFIPADAADKTLSFVLLGALFNVNSIPVNTGWALAAAWMARRDAVQRGLRRLDHVAGAMFIAFGLRLALSDNPTR
ncbi:MAG TPA: LysE family translocator [Ramlibacter sp.]|jgi:threonine/homoserine/homoserine lactone efflux protein|uniref:LysE family translocator n=1 Tax=Ramlibacter sp. TaxID=1917967 RepID=UPI002D2721F5|nr:LysE family translocator [Ramlibacter sp.]HZY17215.1 LysE family translocator [Ramlibacter sp.]